MSKLGDVVVWRVNLYQQQLRREGKMFKRGDVVVWSSQSGGFHKEKSGTVVEVVRPHRLPNFKDMGYQHNARPPHDPGSPRNHESYLVLVPPKGKGKGTLYWPRASALKPW